MSIKINKDNYDNYKKVLDIIWQHVQKDLNPKLMTELFEVSPITIMNKWENEIPKPKLYTGLKHALSDSIYMMNDFPKLAADINAELISNNLPSVKTLNGLVLDSVNKVVKRQRIKNTNEYYIIKELIELMPTEL